MNKPQLVEKPRFTLAGICVRTINRDEANPKTAKLAAFWTKFRNDNIPALIPNVLANSPVYGAYFDYESNETGHYTVCAGVEVNPDESASGFTRLDIPNGRYLAFSAKGSMPEIVIDTWQTIWAYFAHDPAHTRAFKVDFECYPSVDEVAVYIGIN